MSGYDALDELYERLRGTEDARRAGGITPETIRAARGGVADEIGRIPAIAAENAAGGDCVPLAGVSRDTRERIEADAWEAARLDMSRTWEERRDAIVALLDRQAALTEREYMERSGISELRHKVDELRAELDEYDQTHVALPVDADGVPIHMGDYLSSDEYNGEKFVCMGLDVEVRGESEYWSVGKRLDSDTGCVEYTAARRCHHVSKRTVEDVLWDYRCAEITREEAAAEIRELMGGE